MGNGTLAADDTREHDYNWSTQPRENYDWTTGPDGLEVDLPERARHRHRADAATGGADPHATLVAGDPGADRTARRCASWCEPGQRIAISVCDITRAQPRRETLMALFEEMPGVRPEDVTILIATGTHRINTPRRARADARPRHPRTYRVVNHDARDPVVARDASARRPPASPVFLNRDWLEADIRITTGFVEPHFFAGFSGGPKMVAPGLAGLETVMTLHDAQRIGHPTATWGVTEGNPVHDDVREIARMVPAHFSVDVTLNRDQKITAAFAGDILAEHRAACALRQGHRDARGAGAVRSSC